MSVDKKQIQVTDQTKSRWEQGLFAIFACCLVCGLYYYFFVNKAYVEIELSVTQKTEFKIYWAGADQPYSEQRMSVAVATPEHKNYSFFLANIGKLARLRIDTHSYKGEATLNKLLIRQEGYKTLALTTPEQLGTLVPLFDIGESRIDNDGLWVKSTGIDPNLELHILPEKAGINLGWLVVRLLGVAAIVFCVIYCAGPLAKELRFVPVLLFGIWLLIIAMAGISKDNAHPDEYVHMSATSYYQDHWLPPAIDDPAIRHTFSAYGVSRLNNGEIYYLFSGKFEKFMQSFDLPEYLSLRLFNVFLFGLILLYTVRNRYARMVALPFLVSPQLWYVFSYCASDAFALFFAFLAACELIDPESLLHRYLKGDGWGVKVFGAILLGSLLGIVFLLKKNYYPFVVFFYLCLAAKLFLTDQFFWEKKEAFKRLVLITIIGLGVLGLRVGADYQVNGMDRQEKIVSLQEELANPWYKPSTELHKKHISLYRKARGATLEEIVMVDRWFERSFQSSFGVYGYFTISGTQGYYDLVRWFGVVLLVFVFAAIFRGGGLVGGGMAVAALGLAGGLIGVSLHHSWALDFQAQGRYLFPIVPMLGILYGWNYTVVNRRLLILFLTPMVMLGVYSFIFEGLLRIPRVIL